MKKIIIVLISLFLCSCTKPDEAIRILGVNGFSNIETTGYSVYGCGDDYFYSTGFKARKNGYPITGSVCSKLFYGQTVIKFN